MRQFESMPEVLANPELAADAPALTASTEKILDLLYKTQAAFYAPQTTEAEQAVLVSRLNADLARLWEVQGPADEGAVMDARAVSLMDVRNPNDNPGSFQLMAPAISIESSRRREPGVGAEAGDPGGRMRIDDGRLSPAQEDPVKEHPAR